MGTLEVPYRYHKTLHSAGRSQRAPSADLTVWLPIEDADNVWHQVRALFNVSNRQNNSVDEHQRSVAAGPGLLVSNSHAQTTSKYKPTPLPDDHPTHMLEESRRYYHDLPEGETIPFLVNKRKKEKVRTVVLATSDGKRPDVPLKVQIYLKSTLTARPSKSSQPEGVVQVSRPLVAQRNLVSGTPVSILPALSPEKQENTWLQVRLEQDGFNRVKRFRSCFTVSQFFTLIADARKIPVEDLERAEVTIDGADDNQKAYKIELMPGDDEEYMEALTGKIDAWPLEKGRCNVDVILYRHGQVSIAARIVKHLLKFLQTSETKPLITLTAAHGELLEFVD